MSSPEATLQRSTDQTTSDNAFGRPIVHVDWGSEDEYYEPEFNAPWVAIENKDIGTKRLAFPNTPLGWAQCRIMQEGCVATDGNTSPITFDPKTEEGPAIVVPWDIRTERTRYQNGEQALREDGEMNRSRWEIDDPNVLANAALLLSREVADLSYLESVPPSADFPGEFTVFSIGENATDFVRELDVIGIGYIRFIANAKEGSQTVLTVAGDQLPNVVGDVNEVLNDNVISIQDRLPRDMMDTGQAAFVAVAGT